DVVNPDEPYHAARFRADALAALADIRRRGRLPMVVGGTGLYVRVLLKGLRPGPPADPELRRELEDHARINGWPARHARLAALDPVAASRLHPNDRVRVIRAIEVLMRPATPDPSAALTGDWGVPASDRRIVMVGLTRERTALRHALAERARLMVSRGMMEEV